MDSSSPGTQTAARGARRKVLHLLPWLRSGGVERRRLELARGLDKNAYEQRVVCLHGSEQLIRDFESAGVAVTTVGGDLLGPLNLLAVAAIARKWEPAIIHGAVYEGVIMAVIAGLRARGARVIVEETGLGDHADASLEGRMNRSAKGRLFFRLLVAGSARCVAVSPSVVEYLRRQGIAEKKLRLIVNAAPEPVLPPLSDRPALRRSLGIPESAFVVGTVGRVHDEHKRFSDLLRALPQLVRRHPDIHLLLVGDGADRRALEQLSRSLGVSDRATFAGFRADVGTMYAIMDLFALVSAHESFGLVLVEAMLTGLAVVGTRTGGIVDVVDDGVTGLLVPVGAPDEVAKAIDSLMKDPARRAAMGRAGQGRARRLFSRDRYIADVARLYAEVLAQ